MRGVRLTIGAMALAAALVPAVRAQDTAEARRLTLLTFSAPVQLPGVTLPAGTYRFEMADINNAAHTVRVLTEDSQKVMGTFHTIPSTLPQRDLTKQDSLVMFAERPAGMPQAAREWFYPGRSIGEEFVYPKDQALKIAQANCTSVAAEENEKVSRVEGCDKPNAQAAPAAGSRAATEPAPAAPANADVKTAETTTARAEQEPTPAPAPAARPASPAPAPRQESQAVGTSGQREAAQPAPAPARELPRTASPLAWLMLLSVVLTLGAASLHHLRKAFVR